jgi:hypothetical protein
MTVSANMQRRGLLLPYAHCFKAHVVQWTNRHTVTRPATKHRNSSSNNIRVAAVIIKLGMCELLIVRDSTAEDTLQHAQQLTAADTPQQARMSAASSDVHTQLITIA